MQPVNPAIRSLVDNFVSQLNDLWRRQAITALGGSTSSAGHRRVGGVGLGKGVKRSSEELDQLAATFAAFVEKHPGLRIEQINKELGTTTAALRLPIAKLLADKRVKAKGEKRSTTYFPGK